MKTKQTRATKTKNAGQNKKLNYKKNTWGKTQKNTKDGKNKNTTKPTKPTKTQTKHKTSSNFDIRTFSFSLNVEFQILEFRF